MNHSNSIEVPQATTQEVPSEQNHVLRNVWDQTKRFGGRILLSATMSVLPAAAIYATDAATHPQEAMAMETGGYPDAGKVCVEGASKGKSEGTGYWCPDYSWGDIIRDASGKEIGNNQTSSRGFAYRNCTDWAAYRARQLTNVSVPYGAKMGHAGDWDNNATRYGYEVDNKPEPGDIAVWDPTKTNSYGHVAVVESVNSDGTVNISQYNKDLDGNYSFETKRVADHYIDLNGSGKGINGSGIGSNQAPQPKGRLALINSVNAAYSKDEITAGGWHGLTGNNDAYYVSASGTHVVLVNGSGEAWGADIAEDKLKANSAGLVPLYVPKDPNYPGGVKKIETDKDGNMIAITNCSSAWGWRNVDGGRRWVPMTNCGDAIDVDVGSGRFGLVNSCGGAYISDVEYAWTQALNCGDAKDIEIGESGRIMAINGTNTAYIYNPAKNQWVNKTPQGDASKIAIGKDRIMVVNSSGAAWGADIGSDNYAPMTRLTSDGDAKSISVGANDRMGLTNAAGAAYASDEIVAGGKWTSESGNGDAKKFVVG